MPLAALGVAGNAAILLPTRDADAVAALAAALLAGLVWIQWRWLRREPSLATFEGVLARLLAVSPVAFLLGRSALHYELTPLYFAVLCLAAAAALTGLSQLERWPADLRAALRWFAVVPAAWCGFATGLALTRAGLPDEVGLPLMAVAFAAQLFAASCLEPASDWARSFRALAAGCLAAACAANLWIHPGVFTSLLAGSASLGVLAWGALRGQRGLQCLGAAGALAAVAVHVQHAIELYAWSRWGSLALLGAGVILAASWLERSGPRALARLERWTAGSGVD